MSWLQDIRRGLVARLARLASPRIARIFTWRFMEGAAVQSVTFERQGYVWTVRPHDHIACDLFITGGYHPAEIAALSQWMRRNGVVQGLRNVLVDAGANIGTTCIPLVRESGGRGLAIEPVRDNFLLLEKNVESNGLSDRIALARKAVSRYSGALRMCLARGHTGGHFVAREGMDETPVHQIYGYEEAAADTLTGIIAAAGFALDEIALVWADVQGCELEVVESGQPLWARGVPLWAEVEPRSLVAQGSLEAFPAAASAHFNRFLISDDLVRLGEQAVPRPVGDLRELMQTITPERVNIDVLFLPPSFQERPLGRG